MTDETARLTAELLDPTDAVAFVGMVAEMAKRGHHV